MLLLNPSSAGNWFSRKQNKEENSHKPYQDWFIRRPKEPEKQTYRRKKKARIDFRCARLDKDDDDEESE